MGFLKDLTSYSGVEYDPDRTVGLMAQFETGLLLWAKKPGRPELFLPTVKRLKYDDEISILITSRAPPGLVNPNAWLCTISGYDEQHVVWAVPSAGGIKHPHGDYQGAHCVYTKMMNEKLLLTTMIWHITKRIRP